MACYIQRAALCPQFLQAQDAPALGPPAGHTANKARAGQWAAQGLAGAEGRRLASGRAGGLPEEEKVSGRGQSPPGAGCLAALEWAERPSPGFVPDFDNSE